VLAAKGVAIIAGFVVNFSMSHFVVFRVRRPAQETSSGLILRACENYFGPHPDERPK
jgi:hypothetical protein